MKIASISNHEVPKFSPQDSSTSLARLLRVAVRSLAVGALVAQTGLTSAAEIKVLSATGIKTSIEELVPIFEKASGHKLAVKFAGGGSIAKDVKGPGDADIVIIPQRDADTLVKGGKAVAGAVSPLARTQIGVAVRKGAAKPDISTTEAFKRSLLAAKSVVYNTPEGSGSGTHVAKLLEQLGIAKEVNAKAVLAPSGGGSIKVLMDGKADFGITQLSTYAGVAGLDVVGPIPRELQLSTVYVAAILTGAKNADAAKALVTFLRNADAAKVYKSKGMEPG